MKKIYLLTKACLFTAAMFMVSACTEDDAVVTPIFPEGETVETVAPGTEYTLTFSANMNWELESSKPWCKFSNGFQSIKGEAGENISQKLTITEDDWSLDDEIADITLIMGDEEKIIAKYTRTGKSLTLVDGNDVAFDENNSIKIEYKQVGKGIDVSFKANYDWTIDELPEWIVVENAPLSGTNSELKTINVSIDENYIAYAKEGAIKVKNKNNNEKYCEIPIVYYGIDRISSDVNAWGGGYTFDVEGKTYTSSSSLTGEETFDAPLHIENLLINGDDYKILYFEEIAPYQYEKINDENSWMDLLVQSKDETEIQESILSVKINETDKERSGVIVIMPTDSLNAVGETNLLNSDLDFTDYANKYVLISVSQKSSTAVSSDFYVDSDSEEAINVLKKSSPTAEDIAYCGTDNIYELHLKAQTSYSFFNIGSDLYSGEAGYMWMNLSQNDPETYPSWGTNDLFSGQYMFYNGIAAEQGYGKDGNPLKPLCIAIMGWNEETQTESREAALLIYRE